MSDPADEAESEEVIRDFEGVDQWDFEGVDQWGMDEADCMEAIAESEHDYAEERAMGESIPAPPRTRQSFLAKTHLRPKHTAECQTRTRKDVHHQLCHCDCHDGPKVDTTQILKDGPST